MSALRLTDVRFRYSPAFPDVLKIPEFSIAPNEKVFLYGPSGSGKSTLLGLIAGLYQPYTGNVTVMNRDLTAMTQSQRDVFRAEDIGFIFQIFNLVPYLSVIDNVLLPTRFGRRVSKGFVSAEEESRFLLGQLGIDSFQSKNVTKLSIGQQQRVAAARALLGSPGVIIADEPTSALDADAREGFLKVLFSQAEREGSALLFVSHDRSLASQFDRVVALSEINHAASAKSGGHL